MRRLTSVLVLFFLYLGYIALVNGFDDPARGAKAGSVLALVGVVNLPIIKFSVDWWNTLHQPASVLRLGAPTIALSMLVPLLVMAAAFWLLFATLLMVRMRTGLNERKALALRLNRTPAPRPSAPDRRPSGRKARYRRARRCAEAAALPASALISRWAAMRSTCGRPMARALPCWAVSPSIAWRRYRQSVRSLDELQRQLGPRR